MRGLTALELQLGNAFGKTEDVLEEDSVVPLAWQVCIGLELFFPSRWEIGYIIWREACLGKLMIYSHAMSVMFCCYDLKRNKQLPCQKASNSLEQTVPQEV